MSFRQSSAFNILKGKVAWRFKKCLFSVTNASAPVHSAYAAIKASADLKPLASYLTPILFLIIIFVLIQGSVFGLEPDEGDNTVGWIQIVKGGFKDIELEILAPLVEFQGSLYAGSTHKTAGCQIWRTSDGNSWEAVVGQDAKTPSGFGNPNNKSINDMLVFGTRLYAGIWNEIDGAQLWRSADGVVWEVVVGNSQTLSGFNKQENSGITSIGSFRDMLFAGTGSLYCKDGVELWFSKDYGDTWEPVAGERFTLQLALARESKYLLDMEVFKDALYVATGDQRTGGSVIWRSYDGWLWNAVVGSPSVYDAGMGNPNHDMIYELEVFKDYLYAAVLSFSREGGALWRSNDGVVWEVISGDNAVYPSGFGDRANFGLVALSVFEGSLYVGTSNEEGAQIWASQDGLQWKQIIGPNGILQSGFGNKNNRAVNGFCVFQGNLYVGLHNPKEGGQLWRFGTKNKGWVNQ